jgi:hypothetical protein
MKKLILFICICFIAIGLYASENKPAVARISSYIEGIVDMKVSLGQHVKKGQFLFKVSTNGIQITKEKCKNNVWYYKEEYERVKKLSKNHSKSVENVQEAKYNLENAIGNLKMQDLLIDKWSKYHAPFDGVVTKIYNYSGSGVSNGSDNSDNNNAVLEVTKLEDYKKRKIKVEKPPVAQVAPMVDGIVELKVALAEKVKKGQLLFKISTAYREITKAQQKANLEYNKARYERTKQLYKQNNESLKYYQTAVFDYKNAVQDLKGTELLINRRSSYCAPFDGIITDIIHYTGSNVFVGHKVLEVTKSQ